MRSLRHALVLSLAASPLLAQPLDPISSTRVRVTGGFWASRLETNRSVTVPYTLDQCERTGRTDNFAIAGGLVEGDFRGRRYDDSDVFKVVEGACRALMTHPDPQLAQRVDEVVRKIAAAQEDDGYLYTIRTIRPDDARNPRAGGGRWSKLDHSHELYNVGHLYEAAVAHFEATGETTLLDVARRSADLVDRVFGPGDGQLRQPPGHQEIEIGLAGLADAVAEPRYLELARFFLDQRGRHAGRASYGPYSQDHAPVVDQREAVGHAVRAGYMYTAMTEVAARTGDAAYLAAIDALWDDVVGRRTYLTGGVGATSHGEAFGAAFELPNDTAYAETCAAIAQALWNWRLLLLRGDARYADVLERVLYNGVLSGVSLGGDRFFYPNPLACGPGRDYVRSPWFDCSCCPVNIVRTIPRVPGWLYAVGDGEVCVNLFAQSEADLEVDGRPVRLVQKTDYPWSGRIRLAVEPVAAARFALRLRVPSWARGVPLPGGPYRYLDAASSGATLRVNGERVGLELDRGYARIERTWSAGDTVELDLAMPVRRVVADERIEDDRGRVALERGPIVYCVEGVDCDGAVADLWLADTAPVADEYDPGLLGGCVALHPRVRRVAADGTTSGPVAVRAVPYHLWAHRGPTPMAVWIAREAGAAEPDPTPPFAARATASASHCFARDTVEALHDGREPRSSSDHELPRFTWWDRCGGEEWVQYEFAAPTAVAGVAVYWFDDTGSGSCRVPASWRLAWRDRTGRWQPVEGSFGVARDGYNEVPLAPVEATALRIEAQLRDGFSGGILEWRVEPAAGMPAWSPAPGPLATRWAKDVSPDRVHPEYPRPHLVRPDWQNLNGLWNYAICPRIETAPAKWDGEILVPFPVESSLSGVARRVTPDQRLWYRRRFTLPWSAGIPALHFGAVDWHAEVWCDGVRVGEHRGGYDPFSIDLPAALLDGAEHELVVAVWDPIDAGEQPRGKQVQKPHGIWYTPTTGIWQTVWIERLPHARAIRELEVVPDLAGRRVFVRALAPGASESRIEVRVELDGREIARDEAMGSEVVVKIPEPRPWSPENPVLYDLVVRLQGADGIDSVTSYFGMRSIELGRDDEGVLRLFLNGEPRFQLGLLDQGFWPDGLYTAPTDEALRYDVEVTKQLGFDLARKHVKVEPERWYYWCDRLGLLVWQDMPSGGPYIGRKDDDAKRSAASAEQFERELARLVDARRHHPSIVMWVLFNEGWGQFDTDRLTTWLRRHDPTRLVNAASGWTDRGTGHVNDVHRYPGPATAPLEPARAVVLGEFGGLGLPLEKHTWQAKDNWGYRSFETREGLVEAYLALIEKLGPLVDEGLAAAVYTQTTDVEIEVNGVMTYDRAVIKLDPERIAPANRGVRERR